jgi:hypothetical protein
MRHTSLWLAMFAVATLGFALGAHAQPSGPVDVSKVLRDASQPQPETPAEPTPGVDMWVPVIGLLPVVAMLVILYLMRYFSDREREEALKRDGGGRDTRPDDAPPDSA